MMLPPPARRICGTAYLHIRNAPVRLTPIAWFHSASDQCFDGAVRGDGRRHIDQRGQLAERRDGALDRLLGARLVGDVDREAAGAAAA